MDIFDVLTTIGGLCLFLFGMNIMGQALERRAGSSLRTILGKMTTNRLAGFATGCGVTAIIQSSSATTVMVVGFVNSGLMNLRQAINVIMGANVGTTITGWVLSLGGISSGNVWIRLLKPASFTPVLALIGIILYMFSKKSEKRDSGVVLLGFATLMFGMDTMSGAVSGLADIPAFHQLFLLFKNPLLGLLAGTVLTALVQSSSASVGILQALAVTGQVSYGAAVPLIMGNNIGTCITAMLSSIGAKRDAKRAALVHLFFNLTGGGIWLFIYYLSRVLFTPAVYDAPASLWGIAIVNTAFNILSTLLLFPLARLLEILVCKLVPDSESEEEEIQLDERLLVTPSLALEQCRSVALEMANCSVRALKNAMLIFTDYTKKRAASIRRDEGICDHYEDILGTYLIKLSAKKLNETDGGEATQLLKVIGDFERISDHSVNILLSTEELRKKKLTITEDALEEFRVLSDAICEILDHVLLIFQKKDVQAAAEVEPLAQVIDRIKEKMRTRHVLRMQQGDCSIEVGFVWSDLLTDLQRTSDHCSNIAGCFIEAAHQTLNLHETLRETKSGNEEFEKKFLEYSQKYSLR